MVDFLKISTKTLKKDLVQIYPKFIIKKSEDLMIQGSAFYAIWLEDENRWSTDEHDALNLIDRELDIFYQENKDKIEGTVTVAHMWDADSGRIDAWHKYCQKQMPDRFNPLDERLIFANTETTKKDYASKRLNYPLKDGPTEAWDKLISTLYSEEERKKIEWAIGAIVSGDSKQIQKFLVLYGAAGTGKSTVLNIIQQLFDGYYSVFDAKSLGSSNSQFALEAFKSNPLVAIQHDGDLSHIEDNTRLNSVVSHELMTVNEKFKSTYSSRFKCFLFMGTNKPVKITDAKSGLIRRLIDVTPTGNKVPQSEYRRLMKQITFELGAIAYHCQEVYLAEPDAYDNYIPLNMLGASNDFYNFVMDSFTTFCDDDQVTLKAAWQSYTTYCDEAKVPYPFSQRIFKEELKNYFSDFKERATLSDGTRVRNLYSGFLVEKFQTPAPVPKKQKKQDGWIRFDDTPSILDDILKDCPAQYANAEGTPLKKWANVKTTLSAIDTSKIHYVKVPENHIVIDFDIPDADGNKSLERNLEEANKWPKTYMELSKSGKGAHLHYIYEGDTSKLSRLYSDHIEVKVFSGDSSLRRKLTKHNDEPIKTISTGLPLKGEKMVSYEGVKNEQAIRTLIKKNLNKEYHPATKPSIDFIYDILEEAYANKELSYDVTDLKQAVTHFAFKSTNQADYCLKKVGKMHFCSEDIKEQDDAPEGPLIFYDVEVFPNLFLVNWKKEGENEPVVRLINPSGDDLKGLCKCRLVGFNCRRYDNHILYARMQDATLDQLYRLSQRIIAGDKDAFNANAYDLSYVDVYDFCSKKQSLKKWEIELGIYHKELGLPWDQPVPEERWEEVAEYCDNDVIATEAVFNARQADFTARKILAEVAGMSVNTPTNSLTARIIFGKDRHPQKEFNYRNLAGETDKLSIVEDIPLQGGFVNSEPIPNGTNITELTPHDIYPTDFYTKFDDKGRPVFPGYLKKYGKSTYRGEEVGEGGYVYAEPGIYTNVALLDIASMHPSSIIAEELFGKRYTARFAEIKEARIAVKHEDWDTARKLLDGRLAPYISKIERGELSKDDLSFALKIPINSVYGLTAATFPNPFKDERNIDNIVAKRGALFMVNLKYAVQEKGFTVAHIKTDSIKIPNATPEIIQFVMDYGKQYGYTFEHEATYERMCLVNDAVYIAKYKDGKHAGEWTATGTQFQVPYVFKTLFSKEPIEFSDMCETKTVSSALYLDMNENLPDVSAEEKELDKLEKKYKNEIPDDVIPLYTDLNAKILQGHSYHFVGKVGSFCPVKHGNGGGVLLRQTENKETGEKGYAAVTGTKGYRWMEADMVKTLGKEDAIDRSYYEKLVNEAVDAISEYGDFEWFVSDDTEDPNYIPPWEEADEPWIPNKAFNK